MRIRVSHRHRRSDAVGVSRNGRGESSPGRRDRIWRGPLTPTSGWTGSPKAVASAVMIWPVPATWVSWTVISSTRSRRSPSPSPSTTSTGSSAVAGAATALVGPPGRGSGSVGYGPNLAAFAVYLMVVHYLPAHRVVALLESLTGTAPSVGFVHGMLNRTAGLLDGI